MIYAVSASGSLGKSQYVNGKFIPSDLVVVLTAKENSEYQINLQFYNEYFNKIREDIVDSLASGTSKLTINRDLLAEHFIKYYPIEVQNKFVENKLEKYKKQIKKLKELENEIEKELENIIYE